MESQSRVRIQQNICIPANCILKRAMIITLIYTSFLPFLNPDIPRDTSFMPILFLAIFILHKIYSFIIEHFMMNYSLQYPLILFGKIATINML